MFYGFIEDERRAWARPGHVSERESRAWCFMCLDCLFKFYDVPHPRLDQKIPIVVVGIVRLGSFQIFCPRGVKR